MDQDGISYIEIGRYIDIRHEARNITRDIDIDGLLIADY